MEDEKERDYGNNGTMTRDVEKIQRIAELETLRCIQCAESLLETRLPQVEIDFRLTGASAGKVRLHPHHSPRISYNNSLLQHCQHQFLAQTIPHEVAHVVTWYQHGRRARPHGPEWRRVVVLLGGRAERCHSFEHPQTPNRHYRRIEYRCGCQRHQLTMIRHNRHLRGQRYRCKECRGQLTPV